METTYDVIVVGGGGSGLAAAVSATENGASVLLLEKQPQLGGTTGIAVGSFTANRTTFQQKAGVEDNPDDHEEDASKFGPPEYQARNNTRLRRFFLGHAAETLSWLTDMGLAFHGPSPEPPNRVPRMLAENVGARMIKARTPDPRPVRGRPERSRRSGPLGPRPPHRLGPDQRSTRRSSGHEE